MHTSGVGPAAALASAWSLVPRFERDAIVAPKVLETFLSRLEPRAARHASVRAAIRTVRERGVAELKPDEELRRSDPLVASFLTGLALLARADLEEAAGRFRESLRADADFLPAAFYLGACYAAGGKDREAVGAWQTSLIAEEENPAVYLALVDASLRLRDIDEARNFLDEARKRWPAHADFEERALLLALLENRPSEALAMLDGQVERAAPDVLFVGMQLLHAAHVARQPVVSADDDRRRLLKYAEAYRAARGPQQALVATWVEAVSR